jgi:hypothetical protein
VVDIRVDPSQADQVRAKFGERRVTNG